MPSAKYYAGQNVRGRMSPNPATSFRELVETCIHTPVPLAISQEDFLAMPKEGPGGRDVFKAEHLSLLTPAAFKVSGAQRKYENATVCNLIFLDIDVDKKTGSCPAAPFVKKPQLLRDTLAPYAFAAYYTISHTQDKPRIRIMVSADGIKLSEYPAAVATIAARIGLSIITPESNVAVQPMFVPVLFSDQTSDEHPTFCSSLDGVAFKSSAIQDIEVDELMGGVSPRGYTKPQDDGENSLAYLRPPIPEITLEMAREALSFVDPDKDYFEWLYMAMSLKHQFSSRQAAQAYEIFDEWSSKGPKYQGREATVAKWNEIEPTPSGRLPNTIRTLLHKAVEGGFNANPVKDICFNSVLNWIRDEATTSSDLTVTALEKINGAPLLSFSEEEALLNAIIKQAKTLNLKIGIGVLRKDLKNLKDKSLPQDTKEDEEMPNWLKGWCYVTSNNEFFQPRTTEKMAPVAFNNAFGRHLVPKDGDGDDEDNVSSDNVAGSRPMVLPQDFALNLWQIKCVYGYRYSPSEPSRIHTQKDGLHYVNTYRSNFPTPTPDGAKEAKAMVDRHMELLIEDPNHRRILWDWMAYCVQYPGRKIRWAVLMQGGEGCGKTFYYKLLLAVLGSGHAKLVNKSSISLTWNEWAVGAQVVAIEEIRVVGEGKYEIMNKLKELITNDNIPINERGTNTRTEENITNYIGFTNFHDALALAHNDRRYFVLKCILQEEEEIRSLADTGYFDKLHALLEERAGALRHVFENHVISDDFSPNGRAPHTIFRDQVIEDTSDEPTALIRRLVEEAQDPLIAADMIASSTLANTFIMEGLNKPSNQKLGTILRNMGYHVTKRYCIRDDERESIWVKNGKLKGVSDHGALARQRLEDHKKISDIW